MTVAEPTCRACHAATLNDYQRERFYVEPVTTCIYWCDDHQKAMDDVLNSLPEIRLIKATALGFELAEVFEFAEVAEHEQGEEDS